MSSTSSKSAVSGFQQVPSGSSGHISTTRTASYREIIAALSLSRLLKLVHVQSSLRSCISSSNEQWLFNRTCVTAISTLHHLSNRHPLYFRAMRIPHLMSSRSCRQWLTKRNEQRSRGKRRLWPKARLVCLRHLLCGFNRPLYRHHWFWHFFLNIR